MNTYDFIVDLFIAVVLITIASVALIYPVMFFSGKLFSDQFMILVFGPAGLVELKALAVNFMVMISFWILRRGKPK